MIGKIETGKIQDFLEKSSTKQPNPAGAANNDTDVSVQVNYASLIDQATQPLQTDAEVVQRARELLLHGQLETEGMFEKAAENIAMYGI